jgi:hypothetical protein
MEYTLNGEKSIKRDQILVHNGPKITKIRDPKFLSLMCWNKTKNISRYCPFKARLTTVNTFNPTYDAVGSISWFSDKTAILSHQVSKQA